MQRHLYSLILRLALPFAIVAFVWRGWRHAAYRGSLRQRLGLGLAPRHDRPLWLHAASVGELRALAPLLRLLHTESLPLVVTVGTPTGLARAHELLAGFGQHQATGICTHVAMAAPWDLPGATRRFLAAVQPRAGVLVETELWPNLLTHARANGVPLVLVSARISDRSLARYQRFARHLMRTTIRRVDRIGAQSEADRRRFIQLGADPSRITVTGNLKHDLQLPVDIAARGAALRTRHAPARQIWVAGSTHAGEEAICLAAHMRLVDAALAGGRHPPLLVLVPRRPERFGEVASWLQTAGVPFARSSEASTALVSRLVLLVDQMGVLLEWYAAADVAFVGGSLVAVGGHNLLEPAALGKPVVAGPDHANAPQIAQELRAAGAMREVVDVDELSAALGEWLGDAEAARLAGACGEAVVAAGRGAAVRARELLAAVLPAASAD